MTKSSSDLLIVGATSDLAFEFLTNLSEDYDHIDGIVRDTHRLDKNISKRLSSIIEMDLNDVENIEKHLFKRSYSNMVFFQGIDIIKPLSLTNFKDIEQSFNVNIISTICLLQTLLKQKKIQKHSSIVVISSISGISKGSLGHVLYSTTKSSIVGFVKSLSLELAKRKIRINCISPGLIKTKTLYDKNSSIMNEEMMKAYETNYPLGFGNKNSLNGIIKFLLSSSSSWITGQNFIVDGGISNN